MKIVSVFNPRFEEQALFSIPESMSLDRAESLLKIAVQDFESFLEDEAQEFLLEFDIERFHVRQVIVL